MSNTQKALSALKLASNVEVFAPFFASIATLPKAQRPVELATLGTMLNAKSKKVAPLSHELVQLAHDHTMDTNVVRQYLANTSAFVTMASEAKFGSMAILPYTIGALSTGLRIDRVGAKSGLVVQLDPTTVLEIQENRFISEFLPYQYLTSSFYNMVMNRILVIKTEDGVMQEVRINDYLLKSVLVKDAGIVLDSLIENPNFVLVLDYKDGTFVPVSHPMTDDAICVLVDSIYGSNVSTYTAPAKANEGFVELDANLKGLAQLGTDGLLHTFLDAKKLAARQEKLNGDTAVARVKTRVFLVCESDAKSLPYFSTGCFYASHKLLHSVGSCRVTSDINNLLIKGVTHYAPFIASEIGMTTSICASSSAKGGIASLAANSGNAFVFESMQDLPEFDVQEITLNNGDVVKGVYVDVVLKITNAFTAEMFTRYNEETEVTSLEEAEAVAVADKVERLLGYNKADVKSLSVEVMQNCGKYKSNIVDTICKMEADKEVSLKPAVTTLTQGEFENIALSFGDDVALEYLNSVLNNRFNKEMSVDTKAGRDWLTGEAKDKAVKLSYAVIDEVLTRLMAEYAVMSEEKVVSCLNTRFARAVVEELGLVSKDLGWVFIKEMNVYLPTGKALYKSLFDKKNDFVLEFELPTALKYFMSTMMYLNKVSLAGNMTAAVLDTAGYNLHFMIQDSFLNKKASKLKVHGRYMTLLPGFWLKNVHDVCLLSRDMYMPKLSHLQWIKVNIAKHPILFLEAVAGFKCYNEIPGVEVTDDLRAIYANTIFVHPDYLLQLQNDCDGDLARVTFDQYWLPLYSGAVMQSCASSFHADYISGEEDLGVNLNKLPKHVSFTHAELYTAIQQASEAKMNVALFTDNLHKLMAAYRSSPITERAVAKFGDKGYEMVKNAIIVVATMVQTDAMNAIKHGGGVTAGAALTSTNLVKEDGYEVAKEAMLDYIEQHSIVCEDKKAFAALVCTLMLHVHSVELNKHKSTLTNQYERLVFKNQPKEIFEYTDLDGNSQYGSRRANFFGMFAESWNVTGTYSMFTEYLVRFYGR